MNAVDLNRETPIGPDRYDTASNIARRNLLAGVDRMFHTLPRGLGWATFPFNTLTLSSWFQPIFCATTGQRCAYEALLYAQNLSARQIPANTVFQLAANAEEELFLDWLCRALHLRNAANLGASSAERGLVFLNAFPHAAVEDPHHPDVFARMLREYNVSPEDVVIELLETGIADESRLIDAANLYRRLGCKIAIDDFGIGYSNFDRLWRIRPDFVKIDRSVIQSAVTETQARLVMSNMVRLIKSCGARVIVEGIETQDEAALALSLGADMVQGYFFARPSKQVFPSELGPQMLNAAREHFSDQVRNVNAGHAAHQIALRTAGAAIEEGTAFADASQSLLTLAGVVRVYELQDAVANDGREQALLVHVSEDQAWLNLPTPDASIWRIRNIVERTLAAPDQVQVTTPLFFDAIPPAPTVTLSCVVGEAREGRVLCIDLIANETILDKRNAGDPPK